MSQQIIAVGGGGFSNDATDLVLDRYILGLTGKEHPKVMFLPQASAESDIYIVRYYDAFTALGAIPTRLSLFGEVAQADLDQILEQDVIVVGGGNTKSMLALWRDWGVDILLKQALENGTILTGVSAGAICWFEECVTDSYAPLGKIDGLGFLKGSACPHYDGEEDRRPTVKKMVRSGEILPCLAICDYAGAHFIDGALHQIIAYKPEATAYYVTEKDGEAHEEQLTTHMI